MHFEKVVMGIVIMILAFPFTILNIISTIKTCIFGDWGAIGPPYGSLGWDYSFFTLYVGLAIFLPILGAGVWFVICGLTERTIRKFRKEAPKPRERGQSVLK